MERKKALVVGILAISIGLILWVSLGCCSDAGDPYSGRATPGAWYDETWQASGFYRLTPGAAANTFVYAYTDTPTTATNPTFIQDSTAQPKQTTTPPPAPKLDYTDATSGASLPLDIVITEWSVTGHVHFASGM